MTRRDQAWAAAAACLIGVMTGPALAWPGLGLANFGDLYAYHYPLRHLAWSTVQAGRLPFWNPYIFAGLPLYANPQTAMLYPGSLLSALFPLDGALSWDAALHWLWGWLGWIALCRLQRLRAAEAFLVGALYALCPFVVYRITEGIPTLLAALSWVPWCWLAWLSGRRWLLSAVFCLQLLSGHPQFLVLNAAGMALWGALSPRRGELLPALAREAAAVAALAAAQWLPTWEFLSRSVRRSWPALFSLGYSIDGKTLLTVLRPDALGDPLRRTYGGPPSVFFESCGLFLGPGAAALGLLGLWRSRRPWAAATLIASGLFLAAGGNNPVYAALSARTPAGFLRTPSRALVLALIGVAVAVGAGLKRAQGRFRRSSGLRLAVLALTLAPLAAWDWRFVRPADSSTYLGHNRVLAQRVGGAPFRVMTDLSLASPDKTMLYRARNVNGYEAFYLDGYPAFAARSEGRAAADASRTYLTRLDTPAMNELSAAYFVSSSGELVPSRHALPLAFAAAGSRPLRIGRLLLELPRPEWWSARGILPGGSTRLVLSQPLFPGWRAWLDGRPVEFERFDGLLQSIALPAGAAGSFSLEARFQPTGWPLWVAVTAAAWALWLLEQANREPKP